MVRRTHGQDHDDYEDHKEYTGHVQANRRAGAAEEVVYDMTALTMEDAEALADMYLRQWAAPRVRRVIINTDLVPVQAPSMTQQRSLPGEPEYWH